MIYKEIQLGKSVQVIDPHFGEFWIKLNPTIGIEENEDEETAVADAFKFVDKMIRTQVPEKSIVISEIKEKPKMDMVMLKKYEKAVKDGDQKTIDEIKKNYHVVAE